jgi:hypothetical protein
MADSRDAGATGKSEAVNFRLDDGPPRIPSRAAWPAILSNRCQALGDEAGAKLRRGLRGVLACRTRTHAAHAEMRHLNGECAFDFAQIVALFRSGKGGSDPFG